MPISRTAVVEKSGIHQDNPWVFPHGYWVLLVVHPPYEGERRLLASISTRFESGGEFALFPANAAGEATGNMLGTPDFPVASIEKGLARKGIVLEQ